MTPVSRKQLGTTDLEISQLSIGSWHTYDRMDFADTVALLRAAVDAGINLFDVGVYGFPGMPAVFTDVIWGAAIRAAGVAREEYLVSAKLWLEGFGADGFRPQLENALLRGGFGIADLVILGDIRRDDIVLEELVADLANLKAAGLIRAWGVNNWSASNIRKLQEIAAETGVDGPSIAQLKYSVARRSIPDGEPFGALFADGFTMQSSDVLEGGLLVGSSSGREVGRDPGGVQAAIKERAGEFAAVAEGLGTSPARLAVAFTLTHPANITTLFGATKMSQLQDNLAAVDLVAQVGAAELRALVEPFWVDRDLVNPEGP
ncbi:aldo/keto reductase [Actinokineospora auranticolor]|uniref:Aryl-alcohol dehydrogenase-like predicted oxidoreductase n=1 Tax=Actinokineospora auranticolor TaxID=155976 RepID=A0A2S6H1I8_9PSEU|nr:aldo/keto reductase [Actinokineospora auranticolor]PPK71277.1 aryl-alcohol dehydrogenase-like predicted oxidoreductase [Actinokineospora auranticolor]